MAGFLGLNQDQWGFAGKAFGSIGSGIGNYSSYMAQAKWQSASAKVNQQLAVEAKKKAEWEVTKQQGEKRKWIGGARAMFGWAGIQVEGSAADVIAEADREMTMDEMMTTREGYINQQIYLKEAEWAKKQAKAARRAGRISLLSGLGGGIFNLAGMKQ